MMGTDNNKLEYPRFWYSHPEDIEKVMGSIRDDDLVVDIGGGSQPLSRADYVIDSSPYPEKELVLVKGWSPIQFSKETWITLDMSCEPLPFDDNSVDFVFCSHALSRLRDPIFLCREMIRVGKRGFIDFPSKWIECQRYIDAGNLSEYYSGYVNSRWLIEAYSKRLIFTQKSTLSGVTTCEEKGKVDIYRKSPRIWSTPFFWRGDFKIEERPILSAKDVLEDLKQYFKRYKYTPCDQELKRLRLNNNLNIDRHQKVLVTAWQHYKRGRYNLAIKLLRDLLRERPDNVDAQALLGVSAAAMGAKPNPETTKCKETELVYV